MRPFRPGDRVRILRFGNQTAPDPRDPTNPVNKTGTIIPAESSYTHVALDDESRTYSGSNSWPCHPTELEHLPNPSRLHSSWSPA